MPPQEENQNAAKAYVGDAPTCASKSVPAAEPTPYGGDAENDLLNTLFNNQAPAPIVGEKIMPKYCIAPDGRKWTNVVDLESVKLELGDVVTRKHGSIPSDYTDGQLYSVSHSCLDAAAYIVGDYLAQHKIKELVSWEINTAGTSKENLCIWRKETKPAGIPVYDVVSPFSHKTTKWTVNGTPLKTSAVPSGYYTTYGSEPNHTYKKLSSSDLTCEFDLLTWSESTPGMVLTSDGKIGEGVCAMWTGAKLSGMTVDQVKKIVRAEFGFEYIRIYRDMSKDTGPIKRKIQPNKFHSCPLSLP